jgi:ribosomal protein S14
VGEARQVTFQFGRDFRERSFGLLSAIPGVKSRNSRRTFNGQGTRLIDPVNPKRADFCECSPAQPNWNWTVNGKNFPSQPSSTTRRRRRCVCGRLYVCLTRDILLARFAFRMTSIELPVANKRCEMLLSPLRYPGGKASLGPYLAHILSINRLQGCAYYEPFAGGAGAALHLLSTGLVTSIHLNDADPRIYAFWRAVLFRNKKLCRALEQIEVTIE